jgi:hypothetical protein
MKALIAAAATLSVAFCAYVVGQNNAGRYSITYIGEATVTYELGTGNPRLPAYEAEIKRREVLIADTRNGQVRKCSVEEARHICGPWRDFISEN